MWIENVFITNIKNLLIYSEKYVWTILFEITDNWHSFCIDIYDKPLHFVEYVKYESWWRNTILWNENQ